MIQDEYILIPIGPQSPNWVMQRLVSALLKSDLIRMIEAGEENQTAYVEVRPVRWGSYSRFYYVGAGFQQFLTACLTAGEPVVVENNIAYYKIKGSEATLEYIKEK